MVVGFLPVFIKIRRSEHHGDLPVLGGFKILLAVCAKDIHALSFRRRDHVSNQDIIIVIIHPEIMPSSLAPTFGR